MEPDTLNDFLSDLDRHLKNFERLLLKSPLQRKAVTLRNRTLEYWGNSFEREMIEGFFSICNAYILVHSLRITRYIPALFSGLPQDQQSTALLPVDDAMARIVGVHDQLIVAKVVEMSGVKFARRRRSFGCRPIKPLSSIIDRLSETNPSSMTQCDVLCTPKTSLQTSLRAIAGSNATMSRWTSILCGPQS